MKKILVAVVALVMTSAFAHDGNHKHMITFSDFNNTNFGSFDLSSTTNDDGTKETEVNNVALNYAYAINGQFQVGVHYKNKSGQTSSAFNNELGLDFYYNLDGQVMDTCFVGVHYTMANNADEDKKNTIGLEYGHRFSVGSWKGMHLAFSPSVSYAMATTERDAGGDDLEDTAFAWNFFKFDVLF